MSAYMYWCTFEAVQSLHSVLPTKLRLWMLLWIQPGNLEVQDREIVKTPKSRLS